MTPQVLVVGGGMITADQILPSLYQMQRQGVIGTIAVCAQHARTVQKLKDTAIFSTAFPGQSFDAYPESGNSPQPNLYKEVIAKMARHNIVIAAVPEIVKLGECPCHSALNNAIMTDRKSWPKETTRELLPLLKKYLV